MRPLIVKKYVSLISILMLRSLKKKLRESEEKDRRRRRPRSCWVKNWISRRQDMGASNNLCRELAVEDTSSFHNLLRLTHEQFEELLNLVEPCIKKTDTYMRLSIPARTKLEITLRFLATGDSFRSLKYLFRVPESTISLFLPDVLRAIIEKLKPYLKVPSTEAEWKEIQNEFMEKWNFPFCCGAIDGKHITIKRPSNTAGSYFNYKKCFSLILFALVDANYCFQYISFGTNGRASDAGVFERSNLNTVLLNLESDNNLFNMPKDAIIIGDDIFPLRTHLMKPYPISNMTIPQRVFNYRISRARRVVENAFGILASRFRIFLRPIELKLETTDLVVHACCTLHNWLRKTSPAAYMSSVTVDTEDVNIMEVIPGNWRSIVRDSLPSMGRIGSNNYSVTAAQVRQNLTDYFMNEGAVPWQLQSIGVN